MTKKNVVDWATELKTEQTQLEQLKYQLVRDKSDVLRGEAAIERSMKRIDAIRVELCIAAGIIPDRPRPDDGTPLTAAEVQEVRDALDHAERVTEEETEALVAKAEYHNDQKDPT